MPDEKLVEELARMLAAREDRERLFTDPDLTGRLWDGYRDEFLGPASAVLEWLSERGRLIPDGSKVREIPGVRLTRPDGQVEEFQRIEPGAAVACVAYHRKQIAAGLLGLASAEMLSRRQITTRWVPVPDNTKTETE